MRFYNNTLKGIPSALSLTIRGLIRRFHRICHSKIHTNNLKKCGNSVTIGIGTFFPSANSVSLGNKVSIADNCRIFNDEIPSGVLVIEDNVSIDRDCVIDYSGNLKIDSGTHISFGVWISTHSHGLDPYSKPEPIELYIGRNVWIGAKSIILPQVKRIGDNAIIGAGTTLTKDVPSGAKIVGNAGRLIP